MEIVCVFPTGALLYLNTFLPISVQSVGYFLESFNKYTLEDHYQSSTHSFHVNDSLIGKLIGWVGVKWPSAAMAIIFFKFVLLVSFKPTPLSIYLNEVCSW